MKAINILLGSETVKKEEKTLMENAIGAFSLDPRAVKDLIKEIWSMPSRIREGIYWENFAAYLLHVYDYDEETKILSDSNKWKLSEMLASDTPNIEARYEGNPERLRENAKRLVKLIDDGGTIQKAVYYANLTRAVLNGYIDRNKFFKLCNCIRNLTEEDLMFIKNHIQKTGTSTIKDDLDFIDDFRAVGLLKEVEGGFVYTLRAFELLKYCLKYEESVLIPESIQKRLMMTSMEWGNFNKTARVEDGTLILGK